MESDVPQVYLLGKTYLTNNEKFYIRNDSIIHMAVGDRHTILITESGRVYAFGDNNSGQLGLGHMNSIEKVLCIKSLKFDETGEKVILAACGREASLVATNRGSLYAFGSNHRCQLGFETEELLTIYPYPVKIECFRSRMSWKQLSMGAEHTCVLTNNGQVYVWGSNEDGQCGLAQKYDIIRTPEKLRLEYPVIAISCGYYHTALISEGGRLFLFGNNSDQQLGCSIPEQYTGPLEISLSNPIIAVACGNQHTVILTEKGEVYTCGRGDRGQLGLGRRVTMAKHFELITNLPKHLLAIATGEAHTAVVDSQGEIYVFGDGKHGKLDYESHSNKFKPYFLDKFKGYHVLKVDCGGCHTIILAQKKSIENATNFKTKPITNAAYPNRTNSIDGTSNNRNSSLPYEPVSDLDVSSTSMRNALMNTTHIETNGKLQPINLRRNHGEYASSTTGVFDHITSLTKTTDDLTKPPNRFSHKHGRRSDQINNLRVKPTLHVEKSSSEERSVSVCEQNNDQRGFQTPSSTTSGRTSSSISSVHDENQITLESTDELQNSYYSSTTRTLGKPYIIDSNIDSTRKTIISESQTGFFSRILTGKSSKKSSSANKNSKTCSMM